MGLRALEPGLSEDELMNVMGRAHPFIHARSAHSFGPDRVAAWAQGGRLATELATCSVVALVGDSAFVHAALPADATLERLNAINAETRRWLLDPQAARTPFRVTHLRCRLMPAR